MFIEESRLAHKPLENKFGNIPRIISKKEKEKKHHRFAEEEQSTKKAEKLSV